MAGQTDLGIHGRLQVLGLLGGADEGNPDIVRPLDDLVLDEPFERRPDVTGHAGHLLVRGIHPAIVGGLDGMAGRAELGCAREWDRHGCGAHPPHRSGERRVGEEGRSRWGADYLKKKKKYEMVLDTCRSQYKMSCANKSSFDFKFRNDYNRWS